MSFILKITSPLEYREEPITLKIRLVYNESVYRIPKFFAEEPALFRS
jgi:hypothetical protein